MKTFKNSILTSDSDYRAFHFVIAVPKLKACGFPAAGLFQPHARIIVNGELDGDPIKRASSERGSL